MSELEEALATGLKMGKMLGKQAGRKEVVEWFMENYPEVCEEHLTAKLKEWGIDR